MSRSTQLALVFAAAVGVGWLALALPPAAFFSGDSGLKLIAALNAIDHPRRPFQVDLPRIGGQPTFYLDPMIVVHRDHAHVLQSPLFPVISAPLIATLGLRGAYVLPAISFVVMLPLLNVIRRLAAPETSFVILAWMALAASPLLFYALEYWEHAPAIALLAAASAAAMLAGRQTRFALVWAAASGALGGISVLLRPEAAWYVAGLALVIGPRQWAALGCGVAAILVPFGAANYAHSGDLIGPHAAANLGALQGNWLTGRWQRIHQWLWPDSPVAIAGLLLVASAWMSSALNLDLRTRQIIGLVGVVVVSALAAQQLLPRESLWQAFPVSLLALVPTGKSETARPLSLVALVAGLGVALTATDDGGAQWGPRFLLVVAAALIVLAARNATRAASSGPGRAARVALVALVLIAGLATSRVAYRELRGAKRSYERIVSTTADVTAPRDFVLTNVWWFDQVVASLYGTRVFLYAPNLFSATQVLTELTRARVANVTLVWSAEPDGESLESALIGTCFEVVSRQVTRDPSLRIASARCPAR